MTRSWCWPHPLQFPAWKWWPTAYIFNVETIVTFPRIKACRLLTAKNRHAKLRGSICSCGELIVGRETRNLLDASATKWVNFLLIYWICGSKTLCSTRCQQEILEEKIFAGTTFLRAGVYHKNRENFQLYGMLLSTTCLIKIFIICRALRLLIR